MHKQLKKNFQTIKRRSKLEFFGKELEVVIHGFIIKYESMHIFYILQLCFKNVGSPLTAEDKQQDTRAQKHFPWFQHRRNFDFQTSMCKHKKEVEQ